MFLPAAGAGRSNAPRAWEGGNNCAQGHLVQARDAAAGGSEALLTHRVQMPALHMPAGVLESAS